MAPFSEKALAPFFEKRQALVLELEENLRRKDLTPYERSKTLVEYVETVKQAIETCADSTQVSKPSRGPSRQTGSYRDIEHRTGIPEPTIRLAQQHVAAADRYPELRGIPQSNAITIAKNLDALPEPTICLDAQPSMR